MYVKVFLISTFITLLADIFPNYSRFHCLKHALPSKLTRDLTQEQILFLRELNTTLWSRLRIERTLEVPGTSDLVPPAKYGVVAISRRLTLCLAFMGFRAKFGPLIDSALPMASTKLPMASILWRSISVINDGITIAARTLS